MCIIHRKNINFGCNMLQHTSVPKNILSVCNQQRTKISPPTPPQNPPLSQCDHPPKNINFGCTLLQHTSVPKNILSVCNQQRTKISPPTPPQNPPCHNVIIHRRTSTLVVLCYNTHLYRRTSCLFAINNERKYPPPTPPPKTPPCHNVNHPPKNINFGCNLLQHTSVPKKIQSVCNPQRTKISPPHPPHPMPRQSTKHYYFSPTSSVVATNNERE